MQAGFGERVLRAARALPPEFRPKVAVVLGSGLSGIARGLGYREIPFSSIPEFPRPTVQGHAGLLCLSAKAAIMAGRFHYYEGHAMDDIVLPVFALREIGVETIVLTNAAGGANPDYSPGELVLIKDHINFMGTHPFIGPNPTRPDGSPFGLPSAFAGAGQRFFDMSEVYSGELREAARDVARGVRGLSGAPLREGVYCAFSGPSYETPAEVRMARAMGADLVGMSTAPEATAARFLGMRVLGISCVTNLAAGLAAAPLSHAEVVETGKKAEAALRDLVLGLIDRL
ncbi:MAG TPA: purine-nucleoside phosphorylase [Spirochaetales bacterium]|nr:purine-nucleoside phosphorylase [Spirochaetales bacterium]HRY53553.1 purine-nucleoside phosphorylase [Spirochaetia bacterium]HRZ63374.1 purine-nucleoside phosphorylase [Spirochaetia bacterium]